MTCRTCLTDDCDTPAKIRGLCTRHYGLAQHYGTLEQIAEPKKPRLTETRGLEVLAMWDSGMTMYKIAQATGITNPTVRAILLKMGVEDPTRKRS